MKTKQSTRNQRQESERTRSRKKISSMQATQIWGKNKLNDSCIDHILDGNHIIQNNKM